VIATKVYSRRSGPGRNDVRGFLGAILWTVWRPSSPAVCRLTILTCIRSMVNDSVTPLEGRPLRALDTLVQQGKVRYVGCSNWQAWKSCQSARYL